MDDPTKHKDDSRAHWYSLAGVQDDSDLAASQSHRGKARERVKRRRESAGQEKPPLATKLIAKVPHIRRPEFDLKTQWMWIVIALAVLGIIALVAAVASVPPKNGSSSSSSSGAVAAASLPAQIPISTVPPQAQVNIRPWDAKQRFTILIMGIDKRPGETGTGYHTDTMIVVSIDPTTKSVGMLSIPRDLAVPFPGTADLQSINSAYLTGELKQPGGGPTLAMQVIQYNLGIPVNGYVVVSFDTVINLVDAVGGVDIDVPYTIDDPQYPDMNYGYDPLHIDKGMTHMDGQLALKYARTRHQTDDFDRTKRQQQVILALRQKALSSLPQLVGQAPDLWNKISAGIMTNLSFDQWLSLGWYAKDIPAESIHHASIDNQYVQPMTLDGNVVLTLNRGQVGTLLTQVFGTNYNK